jgi:hypothetical protein
VAPVQGFEPAQSGQQPVDVNGDRVAVGVWGDSSTSIGVFGTSGEPLPNFGSIPARIAGVEGHSYQHPGVVGVSVEQPGVQGESLQGLGMFGRSETNHGVLGVTNAPTVPGERPSAAGVFGSSVVGGNGVTGFVGSATGVVGSSVRGLGVSGTSGDADGISGLSLNANGVRGVGGTEPTGGGQIASGVRGSSPTGFGVRGDSSENSGIVGVTSGRGDGATAIHFSTEPGSGVSGLSILFNGVDGFSFNGIGVRGEGRNGGVHGFSNSRSAKAAAILGQNSDGFAGVFVGKVLVSGFLSKAGGGFEIDHPLDPANTYLRHSFVECPEMLNVYSGNATTDDKGEAKVALPKYFEALNQDFRYQLTVIGQFAQAIVAEEIRNNRFTIKTDQPQVKVSWQVTGIRQDPWAVANRMVVEEDKAAEDKGHYLHPEPWGQSAEAAMHRSEAQQARTGEDQLRQITQLLPEGLSARASRHLEALVRGEHVKDEELQSLMLEAKQQAGLAAAGEPSRADRARLEEEWHRIEELVHGLGSMPLQRGPEAPRA